MLIGLTGGIGCGKSTALAAFAEAGLGVVDCDELVHALLAGDPAVAEAIAARFGPALLSSGGGVDRARLGEAVFARAAELAWLEGLLHPRVRERWEERVREGAGRDWVVEIPLLFEKNLEMRFDFTVCVCCSPAVQAARLRVRGLSEEQARARSGRQLPLAEKVERADFVLLNSGCRSFLCQQIQLLLQQHVKKTS